jgi:predicted amidohydrolase
MTAVGDQLANFQTCERLAREAAGAGARMLFLPECFSFIGTSQQEVGGRVTPRCRPQAAAAAAGNL